MVKYTVYNLRTFFSKQPGDISCCPNCGNSVSKTNINPSKEVCDDLADPYLIPVHEFSHLYECRVCGWWAVRESWTLCEWGHELDFLVVGEAESTNLQSSPWLQVLDDDRLYQKAATLPDTIGKVFVGGARKN